MSDKLQAGAASVDISPIDVQFLCGYPHVERYSEGVHDPLMSSALYLNDGKREVLFVASDVIYLSKQTVSVLRERISKWTGLVGGSIMITATHTHSGPITVDQIGREMDSVIPPVNPAYLQLLEDGLFKAAVGAVENAKPAELGLVIANGSGVGGNRRDSAGVSNPTVPVLSVRELGSGKPIALMLACSMHPTVLHEDSKFISADFPGMTRAYLQMNVADCPVVYHTSPAGNQSPRHITRENTFAEVKRIGEILGRSVEEALTKIEYCSEITLDAKQGFVELPTNSLPSVGDAIRLEAVAREKLNRMRNDGTARQEVRTAECDWFGAERRLLLARLKTDGTLAKQIATRLPAEVQLLSVGPWKFVGWPGESFVEFALEVMQQFPDTFVIAYANGETQGYLVTAEAIVEGGYEACTAIFKSPESPELLIRETLKLCNM
jgi:neutral ceramidase